MGGQIYAVLKRILDFNKILVESLHPFYYSILTDTNYISLYLFC